MIVLDRRWRRLEAEKVRQVLFLVFKRAAPDSSQGRILQSSETELLDCVQACVEFGHDDADSGKHCHTTIVQLAFAHLSSVLVQSQWVAEVARDLVAFLGPDAQLENAGDAERAMAA